MTHPFRQSIPAANSRRSPDRRDVIGESHGLRALIAATQAAVASAPGGRAGTTGVVLRLSEDFAHIRLQDLARPWQFLRQMEGAPPVRLGTHGFDPALVDDANPARHYMAFVFVGYWLPAALALALLWVWEVAGFVRYRGVWSWPDVHMGLVGIRHGWMVRRHGAGILAALMSVDLSPRRQPLVGPDPQQTTH